MFAAQGIVLSATGLVLGGLMLIPVARTARRILEDFSLGSVESGFLAGVGLVLFFVTVIASLLPAVRAASVDPANVLRSD